MSADDIRFDLKAYLDGELTPERAAEVERAISESSELRQEVQEMRRITESLKAMALGPAITGESKAVDAVSGRQTTGLRKVLTFMVPVATAAIVAAILFPVFSQSKTSARRVASPASAAMESENSSSPADESAPSVPMPTEPGANLSTRPRDTFGRGGRGVYVEEKAASPRKAAPLVDDDVQRSVVRTGSLSVKVDSAEKAERAVTNLVKGYRGFVESSESSNLEAKNANIVMAVRVPEKLFDDALVAFEKLGIRTAKTISGQDVTAQLVDMGARLKNLRAQEETYRNILRQTRRIGEVLEVQQRISDIRSEIESMDAQMQGLRKLAALSTITVTLEQRPSGPQADVNDGGWASDSWASAVGAMSGAMKSIFSAGIWIVVYAPIWLPIAFIGWALGRRLARA